MSRNCRKPPACTVDGCRLKHNTLLHRREQEILNIVPVKICANRREIETYAFLDEGYTACLCDERLLDLLKLRGKKTQFSLTTVNAVPTSQDGFAVDFTVKSLDGRESVDLPHVLTVDRLPVKANEAQFDVQSHAHLKGLKIPTLSCKDVMLMIGVNVPKVFWTMDERRGKHNEPSAKKSILGWSLVGPALFYERNSDVHIHCVQVQEEDLLSQQIKCLWESNFKDASLSPIPSMSKEDKYALQLMEDSVEIVDGHYQLPLPWKPGCPDLPDNRSAMKRLLEAHIWRSVSSPFCANWSLKKTAQDHRDEFDEKVVKGVERNFYVDDYLNGSSTVDQGIHIVRETNKLLEKKGFYLAKWKSFNPEVLSGIPAKDRADSASSVNLEPEKIDRVLGIKWNIQDYCFGFDVNVKSEPATKRGILSVFSSIIDPLGIVAPVILKARILMQQLCRNNYGWDDEISNSENLLWNRWLEDIPGPENIFMQRCFAPSGFGNIVTRQITILQTALPLPMERYRICD
ncbi:uncharacterized protein LOC144421939 [Styela clava]